MKTIPSHYTSWLIGLLVNMLQESPNQVVSSFNQSTGVFFHGSRNFFDYISHIPGSFVEDIYI